MFDFNKPVIDEDGEPDEDGGVGYIDGLMAEFAASPEGLALVEAEGELKWASLMMGYGINHLGVTPAEMTLTDFNEVIFDLFPRKVTTKADRAGSIVTGLCAFWSFVARQYGPPQAAEILKSLDDHATERLRTRLADPSYYGMAKSFAMQGEEAGFDMTDPKDLAAFQLIYNNQLLANPRVSAPLMGLASEPEELPQSSLHQRPTGEKLKQKRKERKRQRDAKKRNRK